MAKKTTNKSEKTGKKNVAKKGKIKPKVIKGKGICTTCG